MKNVGWICPRCDKVHAPSVLTCNCKKEESLSVTHVAPIPPGYIPDDLVIKSPTCGRCEKTDGTILTSLPPKVKCPITGEYHSLDHICDVEKTEITGTAETATNSTMAGSGGLVK